MTLKYHRKNKGLTQEALAEVSGVSHPAIRNYESGRRDLNNAPYSVLMKLAEALGVAITDLTDKAKIEVINIPPKYLLQIIDKKTAETTRGVSIAESDTGVDVVFSCADKVIRKSYKMTLAELFLKMYVA